MKDYLNLPYYGFASDEDKKNNIIDTLYKLYDCIWKKDMNPDTHHNLCDKLVTMNQKIAMMYFAVHNFYEARENFESSQSMSHPAFFGVDKTAMLFYLESMILFARNSLDVSSSIYSHLIFNKRMDSFNSFSKEVMKSKTVKLENMSKYFEEQGENNLSAFRLLCGTQKGRALRDIIIHQTNIKIEYHEYRENSEKERLYFEPKGMENIYINDFVDGFIAEVEDIFINTTALCDVFLDYPDMDEI